MKTEMSSQTHRAWHGIQRAECGSIGAWVAAGVCLAIVLLFTTGCGDQTSKKAALTELEAQRLTLTVKPDRPDQLVVSGVTITWEDVIASLPEEATTPPSLKESLERAAKETSLRQFIAEQGPVVQQRLNHRISSIVLAKRAEADLGKKGNDEKLDEKLNDFADRELRRFIIEEHGGDGAAADAALQKMGMNRVTYRQWKKKQMLAHYLVESKYTRDRPITYGDLLARYEALKDTRFVREAVLQLRLIDVDVARVAQEHPNEDPHQKAEDLRKRIDAGADFAELAKQYSQGLRSAEGGLWRAKDPNSLVAPYDVLARKAQTMEPGQVAGPIEVPEHFFIMKVEEKRERGYRPLSEVQEEVRKDILEQRLREAAKELDAEIARQASVADTSRFVIYCLERFYKQIHERSSAP